MALRNVGRNRRRSLLTGLTVFFGVMAIVNARGLMWGLQSMLIEDTVEARMGALQVHRRGYVESADAAPLELSLPADESFRQELLAVPNVAGASGRLVINGLASNGQAQTLFVGRGLDMAHELEAGIVWINSWLVRDLRTPFGGVKQSGLGREGGFEALRFFTEPKNVFVKL